MILIDPDEVLKELAPKAYRLDFFLITIFQWFDEKNFLML